MRGTASMSGKSCIAIAFLLLLASHERSIAEIPRDPFLRQCARSGEARTPVPILDENDPKGLQKFISASQSGVARVVYGSLGAGEEGITFEASQATFEIAIPQSDSIRIVIYEGADKRQFNMGDYIFSGFYEANVESMSKKIMLRRLDTFDVVSSDRFCLGEGKVASSAPRQVPPERSAEHRAPPSCRRSGETRIPIATWRPKLTPKGDVRSEPPVGDGRIVYIVIDAPRENCAPPLSHWPGDDSPLKTFSRPNNEKNPLDDGGLEVNLRGNYGLVGEICRFDGFFMNEPVYGMHQGWGETYFGAIDEKRIVAAGHYCMVRPR